MDRPTSRRACRPSSIATTTSARSLRDPSLADSPQNQCGQKGSAVDLAWGITEGSPDIAIAVLDSGIKWRDAGAMADLATKVHINIGEAKPPCIAAQPDGDCNGDGTFDITDFGAIPDLNGNGVADPEDLILDPAFSNGVDDDHNGYVDDIAGWDFLHGDNDPLDTVEYGHGTGEAKDSTAAANGTGSVGTCPKCQFIPVRVGDSFIADGGRFAAGVLFALDSGADVIQEALGAISNPPQAQQAIDAAYERERRGRGVDGRRGVQAPEPAELARAHARRQLGDQEGQRAARRRADHQLPGPQRLHQLRWPHVRERPVGQLLVGGHGHHGGDRRPDRERGRAAQHVTLTADEVMQIVRATADDIDFSTPNAARPREQLRHAVRQPAGRHRPLPDHARLGRDLRLRADQRLRDDQGGARRAHPARGDDRRPELVRRCSPRPARCR